MPPKLKFDLKISQTLWNTNNPIVWKTSESASQIHNNGKYFGANPLFIQPPTQLFP